jgi:organic hydroperoxide reductase OsmC/OhrA
LRGVQRAFLGFAKAILLCLGGASLLFCLEKARVPVGGLSAQVRGELSRNEKGRLRITSVKVVLRPSVEGVPAERLTRCLDLFEDFCVVTQSVRDGIDVQVLVEPSQDLAAVHPEVGSQPEVQPEVAVAA